MYHPQRKFPRTKRDRILFKVEKGVHLLVPFIFFALFLHRCRPDEVHVIADLTVALFPLGLGLMIALYLLATGQYTLQRRIDDLHQATDRLKSSVNVESVRVAMDMAISVLDDPAPGRIDVAKQVLKDVRADLPDPPAAQPDMGE